MNSLQRQKNMNYIDRGNYNSPANLGQRTYSIVISIVDTKDVTTGIKVVSSLIPFGDVIFKEAENLNRIRDSKKIIEGNRALDQKGRCLDKYFEMEEYKEEFIKESQKKGFERKEAEYTSNFLTMESLHCPKLFDDDMVIVNHENDRSGVNMGIRNNNYLCHIDTSSPIFVTCNKNDVIYPVSAI